jgi:hypothetical protein
MIALIACEPDQDREATESKDSSEDTGTRDTGPTPMPWDAEGFWDDPGGLEPLFAIDYDSDELLWLVRAATSPDGSNWTAIDEPVAQGLNSLDAFVVDDGIVLTGLVQQFSDWMLTPGVVYGLASKDLETWGGHGWEVQSRALDNLVDPSLHWRADGLPGLAYCSADFSGGDPATIEGEHAIRRAAWDGSAFVEEPEVIYAEDYLADPCIATLDDTEWLFVTHEASEVRVTHDVGDATFVADEAYTWAERTVPFCWTEGDTLRLVSQGLGAKDIPREATVDATGLADLGDVYNVPPWPEGNHCSSPVMVPWQDGWVMFCAMDYQAYLGTFPDGAP